MSDMTATRLPLRLAGVLLWMILVAVGAALAVVIIGICVPGGGPIPGARSVGLCVSLMVFSINTYVVWPSRWNVAAHTALAFGVAAYVVPLLFLHSLDGLDDDVVTFYTRLMMVGAGLFLVGTVVGGATARPQHAEKLRSYFGEVRGPRLEQLVSRRVLIAGGLAVAGVAVSFVVMGFAPAFAPDPLLAKFFRGPYQASYDRVAPLFRASSAVLTLVLPLLAVLAIRGRLRWARIVFLGAIAVLALSLTRGVAVNGVLLAVGVWVALRKKSLTLFILALIGIYFLGAIAYTLLDALGLHGFVAAPGSAQTFLDRVAAGAPDINDHLQFLTGFMQNPVFAEGRTFYGGLVPGHYKWNPAIYSLEVANPGQHGADLQSGGFRLPPPVLGYANLGWPGVVLVSVLAGFISGYLARVARHLVPSDSLFASTRWTAVYVLAVTLFPVFYRMTYLTVVEFAFALLLLRLRVKERDPSGPLSEPDDGPQAMKPTGEHEKPGKTEESVRSGNRRAKTSPRTLR